MKRSLILMVCLIFLPSCDLFEEASMIEGTWVCDSPIEEVMLLRGSGGDGAERVTGSRRLPGNPRDRFGPTSGFITGTFNFPEVRITVVVEWADEWYRTIYRTGTMDASGKTMILDDEGHCEGLPVRETVSFPTHCAEGRVWVKL